MWIYNLFILPTLYLTLTPKGNLDSPNDLNLHVFKTRPTSSIQDIQKCNLHVYLSYVYLYLVLYVYVSFICLHSGVSLAPGSDHWYLCVSVHVHVIYSPTADGLLLSPPLWPLWWCN